MSTVDVNAPTSITPHQPTLPAEGQWTEAEFIFEEESPPGLFPENQDSNFGFIIRKIFADLAQNISDWQNTLYNEKFVETSTQFLDQWEIEVGLPPNPADLSISDRRANVIARLQHGPFTRTRRYNTVARYVETTFGAVIQLVPAGVEIPSGGIPIYGEAGDVSTLFAIYEDIPNFHYTIWIASTNTPDLPTLTAELKRITPAGISFNITNVHP
jgi:hypothetical protein